LLLTGINRFADSSKQSIQQLYKNAMELQEDCMDKTTTTIGVVGAGIMGSGIAQSSRYLFMPAVPLLWKQPFRPSGAVWKNSVGKG
jgi:hypothetical protein